MISKRLTEKGITAQWVHQSVTATAFAFPIVTLVTVLFQLMSPEQTRAMFVGIVLAFVFLLFPTSKSHSKNRMLLALDVLLSITILAIWTYISLGWFGIAARTGAWTHLDIIVALTGCVLVLEATRRTAGWAFLIICGAFLLYARFGYYFPSLFVHRGFSWQRLAGSLCLTTQGFLGVGTSVILDYVFPFLIVGGLFRAVGGMDVLGEIAKRLVQGKPGGEAKISVVSSAAFGMFSGSAIANVATTGNFTIPLMAKTGYSPAFAAAVETCASTGGQFMPPVLGAAAFLIVEYTGVPYVTVMLASLIPAFLYFMSVYVRIDREAHRLGLEPQTVTTEPFIDVLKLAAPYIITFALLVLGIVWWTPLRAVVVSTLFLLICGIFRPNMRLSWDSFKKAMLESTSGILLTGTACVAVGTLVVVMGITGLGIRLSSAILTLTSGNLMLALVLTALAATVLGMGLPPSVVYIFCASTMAPALTELRVGLLPAHLFIFYFGALAMITPPVGMASFTAATIADEHPLKVGWEATKLSISAFVLPFFFVFQPALLLQGTGLEIAQVVITSALGVLATTIGVGGYLIAPISKIQRVLWLITGLLLIDARFLTDIVALCLGGVLVFLQLRARDHLKCQPSF